MGGERKTGFFPRDNGKKKRSDFRVRVLRQSKTKLNQGLVVIHPRRASGGDGEIMGCVGRKCRLRIQEKKCTVRTKHTSGDLTLGQGKTMTAIARRPRRKGGDHWKKRKMSLTPAIRKKETIAIRKME